MCSSNIMSDDTHKCLRDDRNVCQLCGALDNLSLCTGCRKTWYCCREHQKADWREHKRRCAGKSKKKDKKPKHEGVVCPSDQSASGSSITMPTDIAVGDRSAAQWDVEGKGAKTHARSVNKTVEEVHSRDHKPDELCCAQADDTSHASVPVPQEGSSEAYILQTAASSLSQPSGASADSGDTMREIINPLDSSETYVTVLKSRFKELAEYVTNCLTKYGICVIDKFLGESKGLDILKEVKELYRSGVFKNGQVVDSENTSNTTRIRGDMITWVDGAEDGCKDILFLISCMDDIILQCSGKLENYRISERTKAMVACYPGNDTGYVRHVDNPNGDGRCVTCIYYLNESWDVRKNGGLLRIFPEGNNRVANIEPVFDRLLYFWSDRRNPHEVQSSSRERYAITVWYYDMEERSRALKRYKGHSRNGRKSAVPLINGDRNS
ncbi:egl nine homolog 1-like [Haliotis rubra]|uniref:egl nine homolog 1-like n=1 Tax=Haliotis rubra TaxID=36100 RepID=UPI001EE503F6|nr:egl nine homolog 1-like [Haliotis rubra]XP_046551853.1 egl nine homolog 1-like [Haliotis rubra]XP_046551854.1 egl nine homolog 1-like [Haliotis rubra]